MNEKRVRIEGLRELDDTTQALLRARASARGAEGDGHVAQLVSRVAEGQLGAAALYDPQGEARGAAIWRWPHMPSHAQVIVMYVAPEAPAEYGAALAQHVFLSLLEQGGERLNVIEARMRDESPGVRAGWQQQGLVFFERCRMARGLGYLPVPINAPAQGYTVVPWRAEHDDGAAGVLQAALANSIEQAAAPSESAARLIHSLEQQRVPGGTWDAQASRVALDARQGVVGCLAALVENDTYNIRMVAVEPRHQRRGLARALLLHSLNHYQQSACRSVELAITLRNPLVPLLRQLGFQPLACGEVALWWQDGRQMAWRL